jgi:hypothetical protein
VTRARALAIAIAVAVGLVAVLGRPRVAHAHVRSTSWSTWTVRGAEVDVRLRVSRLDVSAHPRFAVLSASAGGANAAILPDDERALAEYLGQRVRVESAAGACAVDPASYRVSAPSDASGASGVSEGFLVRTWSARCPSAEGLRVTSELLLEQVPSHLHFATLIRDGAPVAERLLGGDARSWAIAGGSAPVSTARLLDFLVLGARHVATGVDHLVFVLALLVAASSLRAVASVVTGFTIGHSATLALAVLGGVRPESGTIEALVGASIAVVAVENVWLERRDPWVARGLVGALALIAAASAASGRGAPLALVGLVLFVACYFGLLARSERPARLRWTVAALFGMVHGFAFSGALAEMSLPRARLASALFGFNVGVELAQLALVALAWPLLRQLARTRAEPRTRLLASAVALSAGAFWLVDRTFAS